MFFTRLRVLSTAQIVEDKIEKAFEKKAFMVVYFMEPSVRHILFYHFSCASFCHSFSNLRVKTVLIIAPTLYL